MNRTTAPQGYALPAMLFLAPALILVAVFVAYPIVYAGWLSFYKWNGVSQPLFIGLDNFIRLAGDATFWLSFGRNIVVAGAALVLQVFVGLAIAYCLVRVVPFVSRFFLFCYLVPVMVSEICIGLLWRFLYNPYFGLVNGGLKAIGLGDLQRGWLGESDTAFLAVIVVMSFTYLGLYVLLFTAAVRSVPESLYEAADIDGAGHFIKFFRITIPMVWDAVRANVLLAIIGSLKTFSLVFVLTNGGPNQASEVVSTYLYKVGFSSFEMGYAATIGFAQMVLTALGAWIIFRFLRRASGGGED
ncbi:carbohydrate ABC transporter membrane protein 1, CUT1 family [Devosia lucknowensis]|uniref:Carbohydrate ABC transporter membrane protein 1, CUT1 family n=1 Tax=Devosia lucknowensis TaxID=1096929 RepID=A0A1Y6FLV4_9HYPH|nr:sugar ABC transporter permease [Devosia lucknowensis]SMQ75697.1 carbohydrate ABC transporter membrane protein 1, CUT1 family [Devosia lucknowensis]